MVRSSTNIFFALGSLRLSEKMRAIAYRDGQFLRIISLHPDHDSAYRR